MLIAAMGKPFGKLLWPAALALHLRSLRLTRQRQPPRRQLVVWCLLPGQGHIQTNYQNINYGPGAWFWVGDRYAKASCDCVPLGAWTHVVAVVDGAAFTIQLFHDDVPTAPAASMHEFSPGNPYLYLGRWGGTGRPLVGMLDEVAIFDRALSTAEVSQLYAGVMP